ncbi:MAG: helix-turn-helix domain-containing protein [Deltaproteobacteria bacterium]|nr:helix-turn-helix domain-containing protein [Deltaproteobacteria bacterium]
MVFKEVKKAMIDQGFSVTKLAEITGYTRGHLSNVINGNFDSVRAKIVVSMALCRDFDKLWTTKDNHNL